MDSSLQVLDSSGQAMLVWRRVWERRSTSIVSRLTVFELFGGGHVGVEDPTRGIKRAGLEDIAHLTAAHCIRVKEHRALSIVHEYYRILFSQRVKLIS
jgi:hypothetical protein